MNAFKTLPATIPSTNGLLQKGKAIVKFYKTGVVNVWSNYKLTRTICKQYNAKSPTELISAYTTYAHLGEIQPEKRQPALGITRDQLLTLERTPRDAVKLPLFGLILLVFFEFTPAIVFMFPRISPSTCFSLNYREKLRARHNSYIAEFNKKVQHSHNIHEATSVHGFDRKLLISLCQSVLPGSPWIYTLAPTKWLRSRLLRHIQFVRADDYFLRTGNLQDISDNELELACRARALETNQSDREKSLKRLENWSIKFIEPADAGFFAEKFQ